MSDQTYKPTGTGLCATCGRDVGEHEDPAHRFVWAPFGESTADLCDAVIRMDINGHETRCHALCDADVHDVGRVLRCPGGGHE